MTPTPDYTRLVATVREAFGVSPATIHGVLASAGRTVGDLLADALRAGVPADDRCGVCGRLWRVRTSRRVGASYRQRLECGCAGFRIRIVPASAVRRRK